MKNYFIAPELIAELEEAFTQLNINDLAKPEPERQRIIGHHDVVEWIKIKAAKQNGGT